MIKFKKSFLLITILLICVIGLLALSVNTKAEESNSDLIISEINFSPSNPVEGEVFNGNLVITIKNIGNATTTNSEGIRVSAAIIKSNNALINWPGLDSLRYVDNLSPNSSGVASLPINNINFDTDEITVKVWADNVEKDKSISIESAEKPDLIIKDIYKFGDKARVKYSNQGTNTSEEYFVISLRDASKNIYEEKTVHDLAHMMIGETRYKDFDIESGMYNFTATIDVKDIIDELDETNNTLTKPINMGSDQAHDLPDLTIKSVDMSYNKNLNKVEGKITIKNIGNKEAVTGYSFVGLRIHANDGDYYFNWEKLESINNIFLNVGESKTFNFIVKSPDLKVGDNKITFYIDQDNSPKYVFGDGHIYESNENNNTFEKYIIIPKIYASKIVDISGNKSGYAPGSEMKLKIKATDKNDEIASYDKGYHIQYYVFDSEETDFNGTWINKNSYNAFYDNQDNYWYINYIVPTDIGGYNLKMTLYCSRENSRCWNDPIDKGNESKESIQFVVGNEFNNDDEDSDDSNDNQDIDDNNDDSSNDDNDDSSSNDDTSRLVLQLQRQITVLERQVLDLEKRLTILDQQFADRYAGTMFLDVENHGRLWYVDPASKNRFYFENGEAALSIGSKLATGITYEDIQKIPVGVPDKLYNLKDTDGDGLPDRLESALGLDPNNSDTDGDGFSDKQELENGYDPVNNQQYNYDQNLIDRLEGKMLLQVSGPNSHGEIWYIHDGKRWYGGTQDSMYEIMKARSLGATPENIRKIEVGEVEGVE